MADRRGTESPYFPPGLMEYLEEKEAIESLSSQDLTLEFASVKVEFCDLDGLGWDSSTRNNLGVGGKNRSSLTTSSSPLPLLPRSSHDHGKISSTSDSYTLSVNGPRPDKKLKSKPKSKPASSARRVPTSPSPSSSRGVVETEDYPDGSTYIHYTGGISLCRSDSSARERSSSTALRISRYFEITDLSPTSPTEDDLETPRPMPGMMENDSSCSYFDDHKPPASVSGGGGGGSSRSLLGSPIVTLPRVVVPMGSYVPPMSRARPA